MKKTFAAVLFAVVFIASSAAFSFAAGGNFGPQKYIDSKLKTNSDWQNAVVGILAIDQNGDKIAEWNSNLPLLTASNMKTITTGLGLVCLGENYRFTTKIAYSGSIKNGVLHGNLYIIGGGDPTLGSSDKAAFRTDSIFGVWADALKSLGVNRIEGSIVGDDSFFERESIPGSWCWDDIGTDYGSAPSGLTFYENIQDYRIVPGKAIGEPARLIRKYPQIPGFTVINDVKTAAAKSGDWSEFFVSDISPVGHYKGTVPVDRDTVRNSVSNKFPYLSCAACFRDYLIANGIRANYDIAAIEDAGGAEIEKSLTPVVETYSPELWKIVTVTNHISNNLYAETILKTIGKKMTGVGSYRNAVKSVYKLLDSLGVDTHGFTMEDGSGLSRQNYVSPQFFCRYFTMMSKQSVFQKYFESLPYPGVGTFEGVLKDLAPKYASRVHAKSGSLSNVKCYSGYVQGGKKSGLIKFSILTNNYSAPTREMQKGLEGFMESLARCE